MIKMIKIIKRLKKYGNTCVFIIDKEDRIIYRLEAGKLYELEISEIKQTRSK